MGSDCGPDRHLTSSNNRAKNLKLLLCAMALGVGAVVHAQPAPDTILLPDSLVFRGVAVQRGDVIRMRSHEYDGAPLLNDPVAQGEPRLDLAAMGAYRAEIIGYDYGRGPGGGDTVGTWIAVQRTATSGTIINGASTDWCGLAGLGGADGDKVRMIILNMIAVLRNRERLFVT